MLTARSSCRLGTFASSEESTPMARNALRMAPSIAGPQTVQPRGVSTPGKASAKLTVLHDASGAARPDNTSHSDITIFVPRPFPLRLGGRCSPYQCGAERAPEVAHGPLPSTRSGPVLIVRHISRYY